jgi:hypothetical protein
MGIRIAKADFYQETKNLFILSNEVLIRSFYSFTLKKSSTKVAVCLTVNVDF